LLAFRLRFLTEGPRRRQLLHNIHPCGSANRLRGLEASELDWFKSMLGGTTITGFGPCTLQVPVVITYYSLLIVNDLLLSMDYDR